MYQVWITKYIRWSWKKLIKYIFFKSKKIIIIIINLANEQYLKKNTYLQLSRFNEYDWILTLSITNDLWLTYNYVLNEARDSLFVMFFFSFYSVSTWCSIFILKFWLNSNWARLSLSYDGASSKIFFIAKIRNQNF